MNILLFGIAREIVGEDALIIPREEAIATVGNLRAWLKQNYPAFGGLSSLAIAVNSNFADDDEALLQDSEIALIPPVSGG